MIRDARMVDIYRLIELLEHNQRLTSYAGKVEVDHDIAKKLLGNAIMRNGGSHAGGWLIKVVEKDGQIEAFMAGALEPVYQVGTMLAAADVFLIGTDIAGPRDLIALFDEYVAWAESNPKVHKIFASHIDALPAADRFGKVYERRGFRQCGAIFERVCEPSEQREAA